MQVKKVITYVAVAFVVFYLFTRPAQAAEAVNGVFDGIVNGANQAGRVLYQRSGLTGIPVGVGRFPALPSRVTQTG